MQNEAKMELEFNESSNNPTRSKVDFSTMSKVSLT